MTIIEAITQVDDLYKNAYTTRQKVVWLSRCESMVKHNVIDQHEGGEEIPFEEFTGETSLSTQLIMPQPYDEAYVHYLAAQISYANKEISDYNNSISMFQSVFEAFKSWWKEKHVPLMEGRFRF